MNNKWCKFFSLAILSCTVNMASVSADFSMGQGDGKVLEINKKGVITVGGQTAGKILVHPGDSEHPGYLAIHKADGTRLGYIGYDNTSLTYKAENGAKHLFNHQLVSDQLIHKSLGESFSTGPLKTGEEAKIKPLYSDQWADIIELFVVSTNGCGESSVSKFVLTGSAHNSNSWYLSLVYSTSNPDGPGQESRIDNATMTVNWAGKTNCQDGLNEPNFKIKAERYGQISITNLGTEGLGYTLRFSHIQ